MQRLSLQLSESIPTTLEEPIDVFLANLPSQSISAATKKIPDMQSTRTPTNISIKTVVDKVVTENNTLMKSKIIKHVVFLTEQDSKNEILVEKLSKSFIPIKESNNQCFLEIGNHFFSQSLQKPFEELKLDWSSEYVKNWIVYFAKQKTLSRIKIPIEPKIEFEVAVTVIVRDMRIPSYVPGGDQGIQYTYLLVLEHSDDEYTTYSPVPHRPSQMVNGRQILRKRCLHIEKYTCSNKNGNASTIKCQSNGRIKHSNVTSEWLNSNLGKQIAFIIEFPLHLHSCRKQATKFNWLPTISTNKSIPLENQKDLALRFDAWYDAYSFGRVNVKSTPVTIDDIKNLDRDIDVLEIEASRPFDLPNFFKDASAVIV